MLATIEKEEKTMQDSNEAFRKIILDPAQFWKKKSFDEAKSKLEASLTTLAEDATKPLGQMPNVNGGPQYMMDPNNPNYLAQQQSGGIGSHQTTLPAIASSQAAFSYSRAAVVIAIIVISGIVTGLKLIPGQLFVVIMAGSLILLGFDQIKQLFGFLQDKKKEDTTDAMRLENWIIESFNWISERYTSACMLINVQTASKETLPDWGLAETVEAINNRKLFFEITLPTEFLTRVDRVIMSCEKNVWARKQVLINAIAATKAASSAHP